MRALDYGVLQGYVKSMAALINVFVTHPLQFAIQVSPPTRR